MNNFEIRDLLHKKHNLEQKLSTMIFGAIEVKNDKYIYVHYREEGKLFNKYVGEYSDELYNVILNNNIEAKSLKKELRTINKQLRELNYLEGELTEQVKLNVDFAKRHLVDTIYNQAILEGVATTYADTEKIIEGGTISGMTSEDIMKVVNLKHAWEFVLSENVLLSESDFNLVSQINKLVIEGFYYNAEKLRTTPVKIGGTKWMPRLPIESDIKDDLRNILTTDDSVINQAIDLLLYVMKTQMFIDGNKRAAVIFANHYLVKNGKGIIVIPSEKVDEYKKLLIDYYNGSNEKIIKDFLRKYCYQELK